MKIALISTQRGWRGGEIQASLLARGLRAHGHDVVVAAASDAPLWHRVTAGGFAAIDLTNPASPVTLARIRARLRQMRPEVLHFNDPRALSTVGPATMGLGIPARIMSRRVDYPVRNPAAYRLFADRVVCVSAAVRRRCEESGLPASQLAVVPDGVEPEAWGGRPLVTAAPVAPRLLAVGALVHDKGHDVLLNAFSRCHADHPGMQLEIAGQGPEGQRLEALAGSLGIQNHVTFHGHREDIPDLMRRAHLLVHPSRTEGLASVLLEAMCAGLPIVASRTGGVPELLEDRREPLAKLVQPADPDALAAGIRGAIAQYPGCLLNARRAQRRANSGFTHELMVQRSLSIYAEVIERGRRATGA